MPCRHSAATGPLPPADQGLFLSLRRPRPCSTGGLWESVICPQASHTVTCVGPCSGFRPISMYILAGRLCQWTCTKEESLSCPPRGYRTLGVLLSLSFQMRLLIHSQGPHPPGLFTEELGSLHPQILREKRLIFCTPAWPQHKLAGGETWPLRAVVTVALAHS